MNPHEAFARHHLHATCVLLFTPFHAALYKIWNTKGKQSGVKLVRRFPKLEYKAEGKSGMAAKQTKETESRPTADPSRLETGHSPMPMSHPMETHIWIEILIRLLELSAAVDTESMSCANLVRLSDVKKVPKKPPLKSSFPHLRRLPLCAIDSVQFQQATAAIAF